MSLLRKMYSRFCSNYQSPQSMFFMNDKIRDSFYLANATLNDNMNWFIQSAHELMFPDTVKNYQRLLKMNSKLEPAKLEEEVTNARDEMEYAINSMTPCNMLMEVYYPTRKATGYLSNIRGFMGQHCVFTDKIDYIGGFRICPELTRDYVQAMAILSSYKHALYNIDLAGAHFGIKLCPNTLTTTDLQSVVQNYIHELKTRTSNTSSLNIIEPDTNTNFEMMTWIGDISTKNQDSSFVTVGNTLPSDGNINYEDAGGRSSLFFLKEFLNDDTITGTLEIDTGIANKTFILEGLGKLGYSIGKLLEEQGAVCVGVKEKDCSVYNDSGINIDDISEFKRTYGTLVGFNDKVLPQASPQIYNEPCDIMIFAATYRTLQCYNADKIKAKVIVEAANCALTPSSHQKLTLIGRLVIPDLMAGAGPTILSYIEYLKNYNKRKYQLLKNRLVKLDSNMSETDLINAIFENTLSTTLAEVLVTRNRYNLDWNFKMACFVTAIQNIFNRKFRCVNEKQRTTSIMQ